jgi:two-component system NtrC family sensor kinase
VKDAAPPRARTRLWVQLAAFAAAGVVAMHAVHLAIGARITAGAFAEEQERLAMRIARLVAQQAADPLLVNDLVTLHELVTSAATDVGGRITYCFIERRGTVIASSLVGGTPPALAALRADGDLAPVVVRSDADRVLDLAEPILGGELGVVRLGLDMQALQATRRRLAVALGILAVGVIAGGLAGAFVVGRSIARPVAEMLLATDRFDPTAGSVVPTVTPRGSLEIAVLGERFNRMMYRLQAAHVEQARARQKSVETERLAALGSLTAGVAHEVNNPLAGLKNCVRRLERSDLSAAKRHEYLSLMEEGLIRIEEVVRQLLDFGRPHPPRLEPMPAARLAEESAALVRPLLERRKARTIVEAFPPDGIALADRRLAEQAIVNLLLNATYVTRDGGEIRIRFRLRDGHVGIAVEDDGPGIPAEIRDRILDPFFSTKPEGEGTGLGLSVTRTIVDAHGGELTFEFPERGGTLATVWLRATAMPEQGERAGA